MTLKYAEVRFHHTCKLKNVHLWTEMSHFSKKLIKRFTKSKKWVKLNLLRFGFFRALEFWLTLYGN